MKRAFILAAAIVAVVCSCLLSDVAFADCGKAMIYPYRWARVPRYTPPPSYEKTKVYYKKKTEETWEYTTEKSNVPVPPPCHQTPRGYAPAPIQPMPQPYPQPFPTAPQSPQPGPASPGVGDTYPEEIPPADGSVDPSVYGDGSGDGIAYGTFQETNQQAVIAWNGYQDDRGEETLILTTNEISKVGGGAMLSILPLPGEPIEIKQSDKEIFKKTKKLMFEKFEVQASGDAYGVFMTATIGQHNIFVWKLDNVATFKNDVNAYIAGKYKNGAAALIDSKSEQILQQYINRGYRFFAFDITYVDSVNTTKEAISYRFKSKFVYYPLQISGIGGDDSKTAVDLIVMTPGDVELVGAVKVGNGKYDARVRGKYGKKSVFFTIDEVNELDPTLTAVFKNRVSSLKVRNFYFDGILNGYKGDFIAITHR